MMGLLTKLVPHGVKIGMSIMHNRRESKRLESVAQMKHMEKMAKGEIEYKQAVMQNNQQGWKDEFVLILVSAAAALSHTRSRHHMTSQLQYTSLHLCLAIF